MSFSYDDNQLATSELYQIRAELQDTDPQNQRLSDEELIYAASQERNFWAAAAKRDEMIDRSDLGKADVRLSQTLTVTSTRTADEYKVIACRLSAEAITA